MKKLLIIVFALAVGTGYAQKIKLKKEKVYFNDKEVMTFQKIDMNTIILSTLDGREIIQLSRHDNETSTIDDDFVKMYFFDNRLKLESNSIGRRSWEYYIEWLVKNKVFSPDGVFDKNQIISVVERNDENITARTVRN